MSRFNVSGSHAAGSFRRSIARWRAGRATWIAAALMAGFASASAQVQLATGWIAEPNSGSHFPICAVTNVGTSETSATVTILGGLGNIVATSTVSIPPGFTVVGAQGAGGIAVVWCRIESADAGAQLRAALAILRSRDLVTIVRADAR
jgi:hypothetical protein